MTDADLAALVQRLALAPHPEGGWYRELHRDAAVTTIYYVLPAGGLAPLHRVRDRVELWHFYGGDPVEVHTLHEGRHDRAVLGPASPLVVVPASAWQATRAAAGPAWCGCTVAPAFEFAAWELPSRAALLAALPAALHPAVLALTREPPP